MENTEKDPKTKLLSNTLPKESSKQDEIQTNNPLLWAKDLAIQPPTQEIKNNGEPENLTVNSIKSTL